jgi:cold shock CspA family protein
MGAPPRLRGAAACGRIAKLFVGQCYGFIRTVDGREIFFHRGDIHDGTSFNDFAVGDDVAFELLEDRISGPRALDIQRRRSRRLQRDSSALS